MAQSQVWEGTWEEIASHAAEFAGTGKRITLIVPAEADAAAPNAQMLAILRDIEERHRDRPFTDGSDTQRLLNEAKAGAMYGVAAE